MHSTLVRAQNVFGFFTTVAFFVAAFVAVSVVLFPQAPSASVSLRNAQVVKGRPHYYSAKKEEYAHIKFDLDADLSSLFNWNTKQIFIYVQATYPSSKGSSGPLSQSIIWDQIIPADPTKNPNLSASKRKYGTVKERGIVKLSNQKSKYQITDITGKMAERANVTLEFGYNVQPWVGVLVWDSFRDRLAGQWHSLMGGKSDSFDLPPLKPKKEGDTAAGR